MTVNVGTMQLPVTEDADLVRTYLNGTHVSGGLWTALTRASNHDHSGGLNGVVLGATSIPDGSITTAKLDPAVLLPYALVDGSKPFTGTVTMNADTLIRDTLRFGAKPAGVADANITRTGAGALRVDTHLGVGVNPAAIGAGAVGIRVGQSGMLVGATGSDSLNLSANSYWNGTVNTSLSNGPAATLLLDAGGGGMGLRFLTAPAVAPGTAQTLTTRASIAPTGSLTLIPDAGERALQANGYVDIANTAGTSGLRVFTAGVQKLDLNSAGTLTLTPDSGVAAIVAGTDSGLELSSWGTVANVVQKVPAGALRTTTAANSFMVWRPGGVTDKMRLDTTGTLTLTADAGSAALNANIGGAQALYLDVGYMHPGADNVRNVGHPAVRWLAVYATNGTIQTSSREYKEGITPLDPAACYQAAKDVRWYEYAYLPPAYTPPEPPPDIAYDAADDNDTKAEKRAKRDEAEAQAKAAHLKMVAETAPARHQRGFVFPVDGAEAKDELGGTLPPVPALFGLSDRQSTTPQADLATLGCALQEVIRRLESLEAAN